MVNDTSAIAVICAMNSEAVHLRRRLEDPEEIPLNRWRRTVGTIAGRPVQIVVSGIGLIHAASATTAVCLEGRPRAVLNYGCSGAHRPDINCGDVVIGDKVIHLSSYILEPSGVQRSFGFRVGSEGEPFELDTLPPDPDLLNLAQSVAEDIQLPPWPGLDHPPTIHLGGIGSADVWTQHGDTINDLRRRHGSLCEEMEAAAIAQVTTTFGIPFLAIKDISNNELQALTDISGTGLLAHVEEEVGRRAAMVVEGVIRGSAGFPPP